MTEFEFKIKTILKREAVSIEQLALMLNLSKNYVYKTLKQDIRPKDFDNKLSELFPNDFAKKNLINIDDHFTIQNMFDRLQKDINSIKNKLNKEFNLNIK
jgi:hypothetical protein